MDPTLTRAEAHKVFGQLYRKSRPPELQSEVDKIVAATTDIFVRIREIEELDARYGKEQAAAAAASGGAGGVGGGGRRREAGVERGRNGVRQDSAGRREGQPKKAGFFKRLFGGALAKWGNDTGTLQSGFFGMNLRFSGRLLRTFNYFKDEQFVEIAKGFRLAIAQGWEVWGPQQYNTVMATYQFFAEYAKLPPVFRRAETPEMLVRNTMKYQTMYVSLMQYPQFAKVLTDDFLPYVKELEPGIYGSVKSGVKFISELNSRTPSMRNCILALYVLAGKRLFTWDEALGNIKAIPVVTDRFRAPESILSKIDAQIRKLSEELRIKQNELLEINEIQTSYFRFDENNRIITNFLDPLCMDVVKRIYPEKYHNENFVNNQKRQPHRLLNLILRDMEIAYLSFLDGSISTKAAGLTESVVIFKQGLLRSAVDELASIQRDAEIFVKKNMDVSYTFKEFHDSARGSFSSESFASFLAIVKRFNEVFRKLAFDLKTVINNHQLAVDLVKKKGAAQEKLDRSKTVPIETFDIGMRFLPYGDREVVSTDRLNGKTVEKILKELLTYIYNYLYIFKDEHLLKTLSSAPRLNGEIQKIEAELKRLGYGSQSESDVS